MSNLLGQPKSPVRSKTKMGKGLPNTEKIKPGGSKGMTNATKLALVFAVPVVMLGALALPVIVGSSPEANEVVGAPDELTPASADLGGFPAGYGAMGANPIAVANTTSAGSASGEQATADTAAESAAVPTGSRKHKLKPGENLSSISKQYYGTPNKWKLIADANRLTEAQFRRLQIGTELIIPDAPGSSAAKPAEQASRPAASEAAPARPIIAWGNNTSVPASTANGFSFGASNGANPAGAAPQGAPVSAAQVSGPVKHTIATGDSPYILAVKYFNDISKWREIRDANPTVDWFNLTPGTEVVIPAIEGSAPQAPAANSAPQTPASSTQLTGSRTYRVQADDTLWSISQKVYGTGAHWREIQQANNLNPNELPVGQEIVIPAVR